MSTQRCLEEVGEVSYRGYVIVKKGKGSSGSEGRQLAARFETLLAGKCWSGG